MDTQHNVASMSSRSFREMILTASIRSIFKRDGQASSATPANTRCQSAVTEFKSDRTDSEVKDISEELKETNAVMVLSNPSPEDEERGPGNPSLSGTTPNQSGHVAQGMRDPFAGGIEGGIEYKTMVWWHAGMVMVAETISLGILSLPMAFATLGIIPGLIIMLGLGVMASYSGFVIGQFRMAYPHIHSWADAGDVLFGKAGREILGASQLLFFLFIMGSHLLTFSVMMNAITDHGACTIAFMVVGTIVSLLFTLPRTLKNVSYYSVASFASIIAAVLVTMVGVSITHPGQHPDLASGVWINEVRLWPSPDIDFHTAFLAMTNMVFAYAGHVAFFSFISELKNPADFPKALAFLQVSDISMYIVTAVVIYYYAGNDVASPALNSASPLIRKIAFGIAMPTIVIAGVVNGHVAVKYIYVRLLRNNQNDLMHQRSAKATGFWIAICAAMWTLAWVIAEGIPVFNDLLGITSALFGSWFTFGFSSIFWFFLNFKKGPRWWHIVPKKSWNWTKGILFALNCVNMIACITICIIGLYASGKSMSLNSNDKRPFSCADNAGFPVLNHNDR